MSCATIDSSVGRNNHELRRRHSTGRISNDEWADENEKGGVISKTWNIKAEKEELFTSF